MTDETLLWNRKVSLLLVKGDKALDLSDLHIKFRANQADTESPNNAMIRVYNLSDETITQVAEFGTVVLQAGYEGQFGVIFKGNITQYRVGREGQLDRYLDILASDGDTGYDFGVVNAGLDGKGVTTRDAISTAIKAAKDLALDEGYIAVGTGGVLPRGKVMFGMARDFIRRGAFSLGATWSIQSGKVNIIPMDGYRPGEVLELNAATGLVGVPEQTQNGINFKMLLNPRLNVGNAVQIDNKLVNQLVNRDKSLLIPYDQWAGVQLLAKVTTDGLYRLFVVEHEGDTRGPAWYSHVTALAVDPSSNKVKPYG